MKPVNFLPKNKNMLLFYAIKGLKLLAAMLPPVVAGGFLWAATGTLLAGIIIAVIVAGLEAILLPMLNGYGSHN